MRTNGETVLFFACVCTKLCAYEADVINVLFSDVRIVELSQALNHKVEQRTVVRGLQQE